MPEIISDLQVKKLQLIDSKYDNVRVKEIRLESSSLVIKFGHAEENFQRKKLKFLTFDCNGEFCVQSDGLKIVIDLHHRAEYNTFLSYFGDNNNKTSNKKSQLQLSSQQPDLKKEKLLLSSQKSVVKIIKPPEPNSEQIRPAIFDSSPAHRSRIRPDYDSDRNKSLSLEDSPPTTEPHEAKLPSKNTESTITSASKGVLDIVVEEKNLDLKSNSRNIPILHDQDKILSLPKSSKKFYQPGILPQLPLAKLDEPRALSPQEPVANTTVKITYGKRNGAEEAKNRAWSYFDLNQKNNNSKPPLSSTTKKDYTDKPSDSFNDNDSIEDDGDSPKRLLLPKPDDSSAGSTRKITDYCKPVGLYWNNDDLLNLSSSSNTKYNQILGDSSTPLQDDYSNRKLVGGIRNMGNTCYLSSILQALLANGSFCDDLTSQFWSHTEDICENMPTEVSHPVQRIEDNGTHKEEEENRNPAATPSNTRNLFQSYAFGSNDRQSATPGKAMYSDSTDITTPTYLLDTGTSHNRTTAQTKNASYDACKRYSTFSCLRETIDVVSQKRKLSSNGEIGVSKRQFYSSFSDRTINVAYLKKAVEHFSHQFRGYRQQDAHEFLTDLLNLIHEEMTTIILLFFDKLGSLPTRDVLVDRTVENLYSSNKRPLLSSSDNQPFSSSSSGSSSNGKRKYGYDEPLVPKNDEGSGADTPSQKAAERLSLVCHHFESAVQNSFSCVSCGHQRQPKHETYRVFSIDIEYHKDRAPSERGDCKASSPASLQSLQSTPTTTPMMTYLASKRPTLNTILFEDDDDFGNLHEKEAPALPLTLLFGNFFNDDIRDLVCERCLESGGRVRITSEIVTLPTTLVIHLKRFRYEEAKEKYVKINTAVSFPVELNLLDCGDCIKHRDSVHCQSLSSDIWTQRPRDIKTSAADFESFFPSPGRMPSTGGRNNDEEDPFFTNHPAIGSSSTDEKQHSDRQFYGYTLSAVVRHIGREMLTGHYVCDAASEPTDDCDLTGDLVWKRYDDAMVTDIEQDKVLEEQDTPYILFYTKSTPG